MRSDICLIIIGGRLSSRWEKWLKNPVRSFLIEIRSFSRLWLFFIVWCVLIASELLNIHYILIILLLRIFRHIFLIESHYRCWLMLLSHHLNSFLGAIQVKSVILFLLLSLQILQAFILGVGFPILEIIGLLLHAWKMEFSFLGWDIIFSSFKILLTTLQFIHAVLHENEMCILIWPLLCLSLLNSFVQETHSFFIFFF